MTVDRGADFAIIQSALEMFTAQIDNARAEQAASEEAIAAVEYELGEIRKLIAENLLLRPAESARSEPALSVQPKARAGAGLLRRLDENAAWEAARKATVVASIR